jgi:hypothetical protein
MVEIEAINFFLKKNIKMYLPTFFKIRHEYSAKQLARYASFGVPAGLWGKIHFKTKSRCFYCII